MADYYLRLKRKYPRKQIFQVVIYLKKTGSNLVQETEYKTPEMTHRFRAIRLWEQPVEEFLQTPGLLPYAVLSRGENKEQILAAVVKEIEKLPQNRQQENLTTAVEILAGLELTVATIEQLMRNRRMQESVIYQKILKEGEQRGRIEGEQRGRIEGEQRGRIEGEQRGKIEGEQQEKALVVRQLTKKIGNLTLMMQSQVNDLRIDQIEALGEDLLDFNSMDDLQQWFDRPETK